MVAGLQSGELFVCDLVGMEFIHKIKLSDSEFELLFDFTFDSLFSLRPLLNDT